jgi:hypothetical protein
MCLTVYYTLNGTAQQLEIYSPAKSAHNLHTGF